MEDFKGLGLNVADHRDNAFIDDSPNVVQFWNSIGNFKPRVLQGFWNGPFSISPNLYLYRYKLYDWTLFHRIWKNKMSQRAAKNSDG